MAAGCWGLGALSHTAAAGRQLARAVRPHHCLPAHGVRLAAVQLRGGGSRVQGWALLRTPGSLQRVLPKHASAPAHNGCTSKGLAEGCSTSSRLVCMSGSGRLPLAPMPPPKAAHHAHLPFLGGSSWRRRSEELAQPTRSAGVQRGCAGEQRAGSWAKNSAPPAPATSISNGVLSQTIKGQPNPRPSEHPTHGRRWSWRTGCGSQTRPGPTGTAGPAREGDREEQGRAAGVRGGGQAHEAHPPRRRQAVGCAR